MNESEFQALVDETRQYGPKVPTLNEWTSALYPPAVYPRRQDWPRTKRWRVRDVTMVAVAAIALTLLTNSIGLLLLQQQPPTNVGVNAKPAQPTITLLNPTSGAVGASVVITGSGFAAVQGSGTVSFNGTLAVVTAWTSLSITATVPAGATTGSVTVSQNSLTSNGSSFTVSTSGCALPLYPDATCTGVPAGTVLTNYTGPCTITTANTTIDSKTINCNLDVRANNLLVKNSIINGQIEAYSGFGGQQTGLVIQDSEINCGCQSVGASDTPSAIEEANYTLLRVNLHNSGHGAAVKTNVVIRDSYIHGLGGDTDAHKDGIFSGDGTNVTLDHNTIECNDGPIHKGCTSAIGLLTDFADITFYTMTNNLLNTNGSYCFYASGGPAKSFSSNNLTFTGNHFGSSINTNCGELGYVTYWDSAKPGMVWSGNVRHDNGATVPPVY